MEPKLFNLYINVWILFLEHGGRNEVEYKLAAKMSELVIRVIPQIVFHTSLKEKKVNEQYYSPDHLRQLPFAVMVMKKYFWDIYSLQCLSVFLS